MYTYDQMSELGYPTWNHPRTGELRVYIDDWHAAIDLEVNYYKSGNISGAQLDGQRISNQSASRLLAVRVWWSSADGELHYDDRNNQMPRYFTPSAFMGNLQIWLDEKMVGIQEFLDTLATIPEGTIKDSGTYHHAWSYTCQSCGYSERGMPCERTAQIKYLEHAKIHQEETNA